MTVATDELDCERPPLVGDTVHFVCDEDDNRLGMVEGQHLAFLVAEVHKHEVHERYRVRGPIFGPKGNAMCVAWDDHAHMVTGTWHHRADGCDEQNKWLAAGRE